MRRNSDRNSVLPASDLVENSWTTRANNGEGSRDAVINQGMRPVGQVGNPIGDVSCIRHVHNQRVVSWTTLGCENGLNSIPIRCIRCQTINSLSWYRAQPTRCECVRSEIDVSGDYPHQKAAAIAA